MFVCACKYIDMMYDALMGYVKNPRKPNPQRYKKKDKKRKNKSSKSAAPADDEKSTS